MKIYKTLSGKVRVKYNCPHCNESLESELAEAGSKDTCPGCQKPFIVPGEAKRKEFEAQLRQQLEAKKEAERQRLAEAERQRIADAADIAQREAERALEQRKSALASEALSATYTPPVSQPSPPAFIAPRYRALEFYMGILQVCGWLCLVFFVLGLLGAVGIAAFATKAPEGPALVFLSFAGVVVIATLPPALLFFVSAQMVQLALDARRDLAHSVALQAAIAQHLARQSSQHNG